MKKQVKPKDYLAFGVLSPRNNRRTLRASGPMRQRTAYLLVALALVLWGFSGLFTQNLLSAGVEALELAFWRLFLSGILFIIHALLRKDFHLKRARDLWGFAGFAVVAISLNYLSFNYAVLYGGVSLVNVLLATVPAFIALPALLFLRERLTLRLLSLLFLSVIGLLLASWGGSRGIHLSFASLGFSLVAVLTYALFTLGSKSLLNRYTPLTLNAFVMPLAALALLPFISLNSTSLEGKPFQVWWDLTLLVLLPSYLAYLFYQAGLKHLAASRVALLTNLDPVTGLLLAALFFGERFTTLGGFGVLLVLVVSVLAILPDKGLLRKSTASKHPAPRPSYEPALQVMMLEGSSPDTK